MSSLNADDAMTIVGTIGGFAISLSLVPQVYLTYKTKCADDISYTYQFIYIFGTALVNAYAIYFHLYAVYIPCLVEFSLIVTLTVMKALYPPRKDLLDCSKHSLMLHESGTKGSNLTSQNLHILQQMLHNHHEALADGEGDSKELDRALLKKSIALLKRLSVEHHHHHEEPDKEKDRIEIEDISMRTGGTQQVEDFSIRTVRGDKVEDFSMRTVRGDKVEDFSMRTVREDKEKDEDITAKGGNQFLDV